MRPKGIHRHWSGIAAKNTTGKSKSVPLIGESVFSTQDLPLSSTNTARPIAHLHGTDRVRLPSFSIFNVLMSSIRNRGLSVMFNTFSFAFVIQRLFAVVIQQVCALVIHQSCAFFIQSLWSFGIQQLHALGITNFVPSSFKGRVPSCHQAETVRMCLYTAYPLCTCCITWLCLFSRSFPLPDVWICLFARISLS